MELRINNHGHNSLSTKTFFSDEKGFEVASVIVTGKTDAVLIDAQWTLSNAHRVIAEIAETGKRLTTIYITHAHPDHYFGLGVIAEAFPFDTSSYDFTKEYLVATDEVIAGTQDEGNFYYAMVQRFPEANLFISNEMNAGVFKGGKDWNWRED